MFFAIELTGLSYKRWCDAARARSLQILAISQISNLDCLIKLQTLNSRLLPFFDFEHAATVLVLRQAFLDLDVRR